SCRTKWVICCACKDGQSTWPVGKQAVRNAEPSADSANECSRQRHRPDPSTAYSAAAIDRPRYTARACCVRAGGCADARAEADGISPEHLRAIGPKAAAAIH